MREVHLLRTLLLIPQKLKRANCYSVVHASATLHLACHWCSFSFVLFALVDCVFHILESFTIVGVIVYNTLQTSLSECI